MVYAGCTAWSHLLDSEHPEMDNCQLCDWKQIATLCLRQVSTQEQLKVPNITLTTFLTENKDNIDLVGHIKWSQSQL